MILKTVDEAAGKLYDKHNAKSGEFLDAA